MTCFFCLRRALLIALLNITVLIADVHSNEVELRRLLFHERAYDQRVCPETGVTKVHTNLILLQIESVDEKAQVCSSTRFPIRCSR